MRTATVLDPKSTSSTPRPRGRGAASFSFGATASSRSRKIRRRRGRQPSRWSGRSIPGRRGRFGVVDASDLVAGDELAADDHALDLAGALADEQQRRVAVEAFDLVFLGVAVAAVDPEGVLDDLLAGLGREQLGHA